MALGLRLYPLLLEGGFSGLGRYDDGVYFAAAHQLVNGRLPYRDFLFLHPPGSALLLSPFAALSGVIGDKVAYNLTQVAVAGLGATTACLLYVLLARRRTRGAAVAGMAYSVLPVVTYAESSISLEALVNILLVLALLLVHRPAHTGRAAFLAGALLGTAVTVKGWAVVMAAVLVMYLLATSRARRALSLSAGTGTAMFVICLPFFLAAPQEMARQTIVDQLGRPRFGTVLDRVIRLVGAPVPDLDGRGVLQVGSLVVLGAALTWLLLRAAASGLGLFALLTSVALLVIVASPSTFQHYGALAAVPLCACLSVALPRSRAVAVPLVTIAAAFAVATTLLRGAGTALPAGAIATADAARGCVTSDDPTALIMTNTLSRSTRSGCTVWVDVTGVTYDVAGGRPDSGQEWLPRAERPVWQRAITAYLDSGDAIILTRSATGLSEESIGRLSADRCTMRWHGVTVLVRQDGSLRRDRFEACES